MCGAFNTEEQKLGDVFEIDQGHVRNRIYFQIFSNIDHVIITREEVPLTAKKEAKKKRRQITLVLFKIRRSALNFVKVYFSPKKTNQNQKRQNKKLKTKKTICVAAIGSPASS